MSTIALRAALMADAQGTADTLASLTILPGCNRSVDMQYQFVVSLLCLCHALDWHQHDRYEDVASLMYLCLALLFTGLSS